MTYHAMQTVGSRDEYHMRIARGADLLTHEDVARLLNQQAETIEVLREWMQEIGRRTSLVDLERHIIRNEFKQYTEKEMSGAKRRIAALEGKHE